MVSESRVVVGGERAAPSRFAVKEFFSNLTAAILAVLFPKCFSRELLESVVLFGSFAFNFFFRF